MVQKYFVISLLLLKFTEDFYLKLGLSVHYLRSNPYYQGRSFKMHFFFIIILTCNIFLMSVITENIYLKLGICVHYPKSNLYYQRRQFKMHFSRIMPLFQLWHFVIFLLLLKTFTWNLKYVHYQMSDPYNQGRHFKKYFFQNHAPFFDDFLSTTKCWHQIAVLLFHKMWYLKEITFSSQFWVP